MRIIDQGDAEWIIDELADQESKLTEWERGFIQSLGEQIHNGKTLTEKQRERLQAIWEKL